MGTEIAKLPNGLTPALRTFLGSQDLAKHQAMVALELEVMAKKLDRFGWERDRGSAANDRLIRDWIVALQDYPLEELQAACRAHLLEQPNRMPNEGHILALILKARAKVVAANKRPEPEPERQPASPEARAAIMAEAGFKGMGE